MKSAILIVLLLIVPPPALAQDKPDSAEPEEKSRPQAPAGEVKDPSPAAWPRPFEPTEEIGADAQISFPTDI